MKLTALAFAIIAFCTNNNSVVHSLANLQRIQSLQQAKQQLIQQIKIESSMPLEQSMVLPRSVTYSTTMPQAHQMLSQSRSTNEMQNSENNEWDPDAQDLLDAKKEEQQRQSIEQEIYADYQNDIEISNNSRMFDDPLKMLDQEEKKEKNQTKDSSKTLTKSASSGTHSKKHKVLLAQLGELQHQQNKYSIEYLSEKEEEDQTKKEQYMHQMEEEDRRMIEAEKQKKETEQDAGKSLVKSSKNQNSFNNSPLNNKDVKAPKTADDKSAKPDGEKLAKNANVENKAKVEEKKTTDQPDSRFVSPTKFEKVNSGKGFFENIIGAFKKFFA